MKLYGYRDQETLDNKRQWRDPRRFHEIVVDMLREQSTAVGVLGFMAVLSLAFTAWLLWILFAAGLYAFWFVHVNKKRHLPFYMPMEHPGLDYSARLPGNRFDTSTGNYFFGNEYGTNFELWGRDEDILTHILVFGTTGAGKTEFLLALSYNMLAIGSGFIYIDPKAAPKLIAQIFVLCRLLGRDDDFRVLNYLTRAKSNLPGGAWPVKTTNTTNPVIYGNAETLANIFISLMPKSEGDNAIFSQNAQALIRAAMYCWVDKRDAGSIEPSIFTVRESLTLDRCLDFLEDPDVKESSKMSMRAFLTSVGWQESKPRDKQPRSLAEQFGYARGYFGLALNTLTDTYGHIYGVTYGEVDYIDVIRRRRILVDPIPSLGVAKEEMHNLGVLNLSAIRLAISIGLGEGKEGTFRDILYTLPTDAPSPFQIFTDEYAAIRSPDYVETLTQGRGLGISAVIASQDYAGVKGNDETSANQILENTRFKFVLKITTAGETWKLFKELAGEALVLESDGQEVDDTSLVAVNPYRDNRRASVRERSRVSLRDIVNQTYGEFHGFLFDRIVRGYGFYTAIPLPPEGQLRYHHKVQPVLPEKSVLSAQFGAVSDLIDHIKILVNNDDIEHAIAETQPVPAISKISATLEDEQCFDSPMDRVIAALVDFGHRDEEEDNESEVDPSYEDGDNDMFGMDADDESMTESGSESSTLDLSPVSGSGDEEDADDSKVRILSSAIGWLFENGEKELETIAENLGAESGAEAVDTAKRQVAKAVSYPEPPVPESPPADKDVQRDISRLISSLKHKRKKQTGE